MEKSIQDYYCSGDNNNSVVCLGYISGTALGYGLDDRRFESRKGLEIFFITASRPALEPTQPLVQEVPAALSLGGGIKLPGREADHSPPSTAEVKVGVDLHLHSPI
jgi:hypothetical protein